MGNFFTTKEIIIDHILISVEILNNVDIVESMITKSLRDPIGSDSIIGISNDQPDDYLHAER